MKLIVLIVLGWFTLMDQLQAQDKPLLNIYTASVRGTYHRFGEDIERACSQIFKIQVIPSDGSLANINNLIVPQPIRGARFAFVQQDALTSVMGSDPEVRGLVQSVLPMYSEDISILTSRQSNIKTVSDLNAKRVSIGVVGSGVWFTAQNLQKQLGVRWIPIERSPDESILGVLTGDIDAMIMVTGHPFQLYQELGPLMKSRIKLLDMSGLEVPGYEKTELREITYPWQDREVELLSTRSLLIAARDVPDKIIRELLSCIADNQDDLKRWGHPKWKEVKIAKRR